MTQSPQQLTPETIESICNQVYELAEVLVSANYFVVDVNVIQEEGEWILQIFLDHPNEAVRVTIEDCQDISQALSPMLDENIQELEPISYVLEVSSPGMFRELSKPREFNFYANRRVEINQENQEPYFAKLLGFNADKQAIKLSVNQEETYLPWPLADGISISLSPDLTEEIETKTVPRRINRYD